MAKAHRTQAEWAELVTKQRISGQGVREWCTANGLNVNSMYNQIAKYHKKQEISGQGRTQGTLKSENIKSMPKSEKPATVEWKELKTFSQQQEEAHQRSSVYIEIGAMRLAADAGYPVANLSALCKELLRTC